MQVEVLIHSVPASLQSITACSFMCSWRSVSRGPTPLEVDQRESLAAYPAPLAIDVDWPTRTLKGKSVPGAWPIPNETLVVSWPDTPPAANTLPKDTDPR